MRTLLPLVQTLIDSSKILSLRRFWQLALSLMALSIISLPVQWFSVAICFWIYPAFTADLLNLQDLRQKQIDKRLLNANRKRIFRDWQVNEQVLVRNAITASDKLKPTYKGPYRIIQVHTNGNVTIQHGNGVQERINVRRLTPFVDA